MNELYKHQTAAIASTERAFKKHQGALVVLPTGSGKTRIFAELAQRWVKKQKSRVLIVAPRRDLVTQAHAEIRRNTSLAVDIEMAKQRANGAPIVVGTAQSVSQRLERYVAKEFGLVVFDEADLAAAPSYRRIADHFPRAKRYGTTATPKRFDGVGLDALFSTTAYQKNVTELIESNHLCRISRRGVKITRAYRAKLKDGDFDQKWLDKIFSHEKHLHEVVKPTLLRAGSRKTLVFGVSVEHARMLAALFNRYKPGCARSIAGGDKDREETLAAFRRGEFQFLCNCVLINRGVDIPDIACIAMARPTLSHTMYMQMLGRGTRVAKGKKNCLVLDFTMNSDVHALTVYDALSGENELAAALAEERENDDEEDVDVVKALDDANALLRRNEKVREHIRAVVDYRLRRVKGIDWSNVTVETWRTLSDTQIAKQLNCVRQMVSKNRPKSIPSPLAKAKYDWSQITDEMWRTMTNKEVAEKLNCGLDVVWDRRPKQCPPPKRLVITSAITEEMWRTMTSKQIAKQIGCGIVTVFRARPKNIPAPRPLGPVRRKLTRFTEKMWRAQTNEEIAQKLGCSSTAVHTHRPKQWPPPVQAIWREGRRCRLQIQQRLLTMATQKKPRPKNCTRIGRALVQATNKSQHNYDAAFDRKIRRAAPWWWSRTLWWQSRKPKKPSTAT